MAKPCNDPTLQVTFDVSPGIDATAYPDYNTAIAVLSSALHALADKQRKNDKKDCSTADCPATPNLKTVCKSQLLERPSELGSVSSFTDRMHKLPNGATTDVWWKVSFGGLGANQQLIKKQGHAICSCCPIVPPAAAGALDVPKKELDVPKKEPAASDKPK